MNYFQHFSFALKTTRAGTTYGRVHIAGPAGRSLCGIKCGRNMQAELVDATCERCLAAWKKNQNTQTSIGPNQISPSPVS